MKVMVSLTVNEGKQLIARAIAQMPEVTQARGHGRLLLKGGTTVSALAELLVGAPMRVSGRITPNGLKSSAVQCSAPHSILIEGGSWKNVDDNLLEVVESLGAQDVVVIGANIIDTHGGAAMMAGSSLGGTPGKSIAGFTTEGATMIVAAGLEKLIPGTVADAIRAAGRKGVAKSLGMSVGLMPLVGRVVTEVEAIELLAHVRCQVIGRGGLFGAEGGVSMVVEGEPVEVERIFDLVLGLKGAGVAGAPESLPECEGASGKCKDHMSCIYRTKKVLQR